MLCLFRAEAIFLPSPRRSVPGEPPPSGGTPRLVRNRVERWRWDGRSVITRRVVKEDVMLIDYLLLALRPLLRPLQLSTHRIHGGKMCGRFDLSSFPSSVSCSFIYTSIFSSQRQQQTHLLVDFSTSITPRFLRLFIIPCSFFHPEPFVHRCLCCKGRDVKFLVFPPPILSSHRFPLFLSLIPPPVSPEHFFLFAPRIISRTSNYFLHICTCRVFRAFTTFAKRLLPFSAPFARSSLCLHSVPGR